MNSICGASAVNLDGWHFTKGVVDTFPSVMLGAGEYYVTAINAVAINHVLESTSGNGKVVH
jgi:hypothetical protein